MARSTKKPPMTYSQAGVSLSANTQWIKAIRASMQATFGPRVMDRHNAFAGLYRLDYDEQLFRRNYRKPVLVSCADGVGTKVLLAIESERLDTIGIDLVAMNVNDLITCGAEPLFFLDYLAVNQLDGDALGAVIAGIAAGCRESGCALLGGETAEMPDVYRRGHMDLAGFCVGVVELDRIIDGSHIRPGDMLVGLPSSGVHSNGYTLVRRLIERDGCSLGDGHPLLDDTIGEALLAPTRIYVRSVRAVQEAYPRTRVIAGMVHVTGGGLHENITRVLPPGCGATVHTRSWNPPPVFDFLRQLGITRAEMFRVFNMGIGFVLVVRPRFVNGVVRALQQTGEQPVCIGKVTAGARRVLIRA